MIKQLLESALIFTLTIPSFSDGSIGGHTFIPETGDNDGPILNEDLAENRGVFEIVGDYDDESGTYGNIAFGPYDTNYKNNIFDVTLRVGSMYSGLFFDCYAMIYYEKNGEYEPYVDLDEMGTERIAIPTISDGAEPGLVSVRFTTTFFGRYNIGNQYTDIVLVFYFQQMKNDTEQYGNPKYFSARAVEQGYGVWEIDTSDSEYEPYDNYFVFGPDVGKGNITETLDFTDTKDAICEEKYLKVNDYFGLKTTTKDANKFTYDPSDDNITASIYIDDPERYFPYMHGGVVSYFEVTMENKSSPYQNDTDKKKNIIQKSLNFRVGGTQYWVHRHTLEMAPTQIDDMYDDTYDFYFKSGYYDEIKENCEFYFVARNVGYNQATYYTKIDFLADHDYFGDCTESNYCMAGGRGGH